MVKRIIIAAIILPVVTVFIFIENPYPFAALGIFALTLAVYEFFMMLEKKGLKTYKTAGILAGLALFAVVITGAPAEWIYPGLAGFVIILFILVIFSNDYKNLPAVFFTAAGVLYISVLGSFGIKFKFMENGQWWLFILLLMTWVYDAGAYFVGSAIGRHKLLPRISPGKTVEGCAGGVVINVITSVIVFYTVIPAGLGLRVYDMAVLAVILSFAGQAGDLSASLVKRYCGVKNSSGLLGPHGGLMDKIDSSIFNAPALMLYITMVPGIL